jgi:capsular polysaccharide export protein
MKNFSPVRRRFLFLQGPPGPFFWLLGQRLAKQGHPVFRINFNGGDRADWPGKASNYRGSQAGWNRYFDTFVRTHGITDILLFGDCRPLHLAAHGIAKLRGINIHVFEEGYIRPHWVTMEPDGVNGHSRLSRDPEWLLEQAVHLPPVPPPIPITASFQRRMRDALRYYTADCANRWQFPLFRSHRPGSLIVEGLGWLLKFARERLYRERTAKTVAHINRQHYFLFPLQLNSDYQIRTHSPFKSMREATLFVMQSFADHAPADVSLVIKEHPLDCTFGSWSAFIRRHAKRLGLSDRIIHVAGGDLGKMARNSEGMVTVNSTSGTLGLSAGTPVFVLGSAIYKVPGITHEGILDEFWTAPRKPDPKLYDALKRVLHARCLISGGFASQSAITTLIDATLVRLFEDPAHIPMKIEKTGQILNDQAAAAMASSVGT